MLFSVFIEQAIRLSPGGINRSSTSATDDSLTFDDAANRVSKTKGDNSGSSRKCQRSRSSGSDCQNGQTRRQRSRENENSSTERKGIFCTPTKNISRSPKKVSMDQRLVSPSKHSGNLLSPKSSPVKSQSLSESRGHVEAIQSAKDKSVIISPAVNHSSAGDNTISDIEKDETIAVSLISFDTPLIDSVDNCSQNRDKKLDENQDNDQLNSESIEPKQVQVSEDTSRRLDKRGSTEMGMLQPG